MATGMAEPVGFSNSSAGPPPGDFDTRSVTAQISRLGSTGSATRASSRSLSSGSMNEFRSLNMWRGEGGLKTCATGGGEPGVDTHRVCSAGLQACSYRLHFVSNCLCKGERAAAGESVDE